MTARVSPLTGEALVDATASSSHALRRRSVASTTAIATSSGGGTNLSAPSAARSVHRRNSLRTASLRQQHARTAVMERELPLSLLRVLFGALSLSLVLSDVLRSGLGIRFLAAGLPSTGASYQPLTPSSFIFSGPGNSSYAALERATASEQQVRVWLYKYDAMSLVWRAMALNDAASIGRAFPTCLLQYEQSCAADGGDDHDATFGGDTVFAMMDALADGLGRGRRPTRAGEPASTTLRTRSLFTDRAHHLLLPQLFGDEVWRVHQGLHYSPEALAFHLDASNRPGSLCYGSGVRPAFCGELFANYRRACKRGVRKCSDVGLLHLDVLTQVRGVQALYPALAVDLTLMDSQDDAQEALGGLASVGFRRGETTSVIRARNCSASGDCETSFILERRYSAARVTSDADEWFVVVAVLRAAGQAYVFLRVLLLVASCARWVRASRSSAPGAGRGSSALRDTLRLLGKVPVQCLVYGSPLPVLCYALAHLVDSPATYLLLNGSFLSSGGLRSVTPAQFLPLAVMQMRNVWLFAALLQLAVALHSSDGFGWRRCQHQAMAPPSSRADSRADGRAAAKSELDTGDDQQHRPFQLRGVLGVPEYALSVLSCVTVVAQYRLPAFRSAPILALYKLSGVRSARLAAVKYQHAAMAPHRGAGARQLGGVIIDLKFLVSALLLLLGAFVAVNAVVAALNGVIRWRRRRRTSARGGEAGPTRQDYVYAHGPTTDGLFRPWRFGSRTPVPYSAGVLWPKTALAVHWTSDFFCLERVLRTRVAPAASTGPQPSSVPSRSPLASFSKQLMRLDKGPTAMLVTGFLHASSSLRRAPRSVFAPGSPVMSSRTFDRLQSRMERVAERDERVGASVAFMNLVVMSDPLVLLYATRLSHVSLGYYAVDHSSELLLLPRAAARDDDNGAELTLLAKVQACDLSWCELMQCG